MQEPKEMLVVAVEFFDTCMSRPQLNIDTSYKTTTYVLSASLLLPVTKTIVVKQVFLESRQLLLVTNLRVLDLLLICKDEKKIMILIT